MSHLPTTRRLAIVLFAGLALGVWIAVTTHEPVQRPEPQAAAFIPSLDNTPGFPQIKSGDFELIDHLGKRRTSASPDGEYQLLFFGYAKCKAICSVALPTMAEATDLLETMGHPVTPVLVTVDPKRDTVEALHIAVSDMHDKMIGLTGSAENLSKAYDAFQITKTFVFEHPEEGAVYTHGSNIFLLGPKGGFKTILPPITSPVRIAEIVAGYIREEKEGQS